MIARSLFGNSELLPGSESPLQLSGKPFHFVGVFAANLKQRISHRITGAYLDFRAQVAARSQDRSFLLSVRQDDDLCRACWKRRRQFERKVMVGRNLHLELVARMGQC